MLEDVRACDMAAWAHSVTVAAAKRRGQSTSARLLACWCTSIKAKYYFKPTFGTILSGCSGAATAATVMLALALWNAVDDTAGHPAGIPNMVAVVASEAARLLVGASRWLAGG